LMSNDFWSTIALYINLRKSCAKQKEMLKIMISRKVSRYRHGFTLIATVPLCLFYPVIFNSIFVKSWDGFRLLRK
jgi:hypothetical protein